jgi:hypothetical protein
MFLFTFAVLKACVSVFLFFSSCFSLRPSLYSQNAHSQSPEQRHCHSVSPIFSILSVTVHSLLAPTVSQIFTVIRRPLQLIFEFTDANRSEFRCDRAQSCTACQYFNSSCNFEEIPQGCDRTANLPLPVPVPTAVALIATSVGRTQIMRYERMTSACNSNDNKWYSNNFPCRGDTGVGDSASRASARQRPSSAQPGKAAQAVGSAASKCRTNTTKCQFPSCRESWRTRSREAAQRNSVAHPAAAAVGRHDSSSASSLADLQSCYYCEYQIRLMALGRVSYCTAHRQCCNKCGCCSSECH